MGRLQVFGSYQLVERIGMGAVGEVYRAVQRPGGRVVTLKRLMATAGQKAEVVASLRAEAELLRALDHPGIAKVVDVGEAQGSHYIAYEFVSGRDLRALQDRLRRPGEPSGSPPRRAPSYPGHARAEAEPAPLLLDVALYVALRLAEALAHAHTRTDAQGRPLGLVHRDVSPPNVLVAFDGSVKLLDFGIALAAGRLVRTDAGQVKGTVGYMSPEQVRGDKVDARSDIYSLGICLWEMVTGRRLFDALLPHEVGKRIAAGDIPAPRAAGANISAALEETIRKALAHSPDHRYADAVELQAALEDRASAERLLTDPVRVARYVRSLFPEAAAEEAASREESLDMADADNKGGGSSDLDVFEGLAKKGNRAASPGLTPPPPSQARKATLMGGLGPLPPPAAPPPSKSAPPPAPNLPAPLPPPASLRGPGSLPPPVAPPPKSNTLPGMTALPAPIPPPPASKLPAPPSSTLPSLPAPLPPPASLSAPLPPPPGAKPLPPPPSMGVPPLPPSGLAALPPPAPPPGAKPLPPPPGQSAALPPPAPPPEKAAGKAAVDMDWDDEEESTHVYDKAEHGARPTPTKQPKVNAAAALLASSGGSASAVKAGSVAPPPQAIPAPPPIPADLRGEPTAVRQRVVPASGGGSKAGAILGGLALLVVLGLAVFMFLPKTGEFKINVSAKSGATVGAVDIYVDGQKKCETTPCVIAKLEAGPKTIKVIAPGYPPADVTESVESGKEKVVFVTLESGAATPVPGPTPTGPVGNVAALKITGTEGEKSVRVIVDGSDKGTLPVDLKDLSPGSHKVRFDGGERYEKLEQTVELAAGQSKDLGEIKLKVLKGQVTLDLVTPGTSVTLVKRGDKKVEKKLTEQMLKNPPVKLDIDPTENWRVVVTKKGFDDFTQDLTFEDGQAEKTVKVELSAVGKAPVAPVPGPMPTGDAPKVTPTAKAVEPPATGNGTLNMNSIPVSKVILDGKPLGSTPKMGVSVSAGSHTVTFSHPEQGKKSVTVVVKAGETKTAAVKF